MAKKKTVKKTEEIPEIKEKAPAIGVLNFGKVTASFVIWEDKNLAEVTVSTDGQNKKILMDLTEV